MSSKRPFETIVEIHGPTVLRVCRAVVRAIDAEDAWSETFLSALRAGVTTTTAQPREIGQRTVELDWNESYHRRAATSPHAVGGAGLRGCWPDSCGERLSALCWSRRDLHTLEA